MKRFVAILVALLVLSTQSAFSEERTLNIVFIPKAGDQDFWKFMRKGVDRAVAESGNVRLTWRGPAYNDDTESQIAIVEAYTASDVDAIVVAPTDGVRLVPAVKKAAEKGIPIIVVDSGISARIYQNFIATDNYSAGKLAAKHLSELLGGRGNVVLYRTVKGSASTDERGEGFLAYLKEESSKLKVVADIYSGGSRGRSLRSALKLLKETPHIDGIFAVNESSSDGMLRALRESGLAGKIRLIRFDSTDYLLDGLRNKAIDGLIVQNPRQMGYLAMKAAIAAARKAPVKDVNIHTGTEMVTLGNLSRPEIQSLLKP